MKRYNTRGESLRLKYLRANIGLFYVYAISYLFISFCAALDKCQGENQLHNMQEGYSTPLLLPPVWNQPLQSSEVLVNREVRTATAVKRQYRTDDIQNNQRVDNSPITNVQNFANQLSAIVDTGRNEIENYFLAEICIRALALERRNLIPAASTVAMAILESNYGKSQLAGRYHNFFGLKHKASDQYQFIDMPTRENGKLVRANFCAYNDNNDGLEGFAQFLAAPHYNKAMDRVIESKKQGHLSDPIKFVLDLLKAGYCPEPDYPVQIKAIYTRHELYRLNGLADTVS